jgi:hypothetical protein
LLEVVVEVALEVNLGLRHKLVVAVAVPHTMF